jgi:hypothetical protein
LNYIPTGDTLNTEDFEWNDRWGGLMKSTPAGKTAPLIQARRFFYALRDFEVFSGESIHGQIKILRCL